MRILVIGSGGREHAICWALKHTSSEDLQLFCAPGNAGISEIAECVSVDGNDNEALASFAKSSKIDLTMVGPEAPLATGIVDTFLRAGLRIVGPTQEAAQLESSKAFAKDFMRRHRIPTARYHVVASVDEASAILKSGEFGEEDAPVVIKADGLAAGKGVFVASNRSEAFRALEELAAGIIGADAMRRIVIEEMLVGREVSVLLFADGKDFHLMPPARDHKRVGEGDTGPNTGGMGSITDETIIGSDMLDRVVHEVVEPTLQGCRDEGFPFRGILFVGLMLTENGPSVLEYNVRFGDPETQAILVRLKTDLAQIFEAIVETRLGTQASEWSSDPSACIVLASRGYPAKPQIGQKIAGLDHAAQHRHVSIFHAATSRSNGNWLTAGGRVLGVTATGETLEVALSRSYAAVGEITWDGMQFRRDIGQIR
jgi:phosphoribosylamine---glycine ligase